jgi:hypothetical protein
MGGVARAIAARPLGFTSALLPRMDSWVILFAFIGLAALLMSAFASRSGQSGVSDRRLARIERRLELIMDRLEIAETEPAMPDVVAHLENGKKIDAIKAYRKQTGAGLKEAKDAVDAMARERGL